MSLPVGTVGMAMAATFRTNSTYADAIEARLHLERLLESIPVDNDELYKQVQKVHELSVLTINAAWKAKVAAEQIEEMVRQAALH